MRREVERPCRAIPHEDLAVQWDVCIEMVAWDGRWASSPPFPGMREVFARNFATLGRAVAEGVEIGFHLCYEDLDARHFVEPLGAAKMVEMANLITASVERPVTWLHLPVPMNRTDEGFYAPLQALELQLGTELYRRLVHAGDGVEGTRLRMEVARKYLTGFGLASECGISRRRDSSLARRFIETYAGAAAD
jgi:hypothetical protein